ncbi:NAD(P)H-dependent oxidoreductase [Hydrogenophaga sp. BPS33]|uniref:NAD(P)H-dependent oxidoreductase n=1 Tax=Hydrogenophaga sp. BPS33 TaxID=2651974 RepID=UPI0013200F5C|nr:NAD(P)H-dependent oxidoreductase [Hydrogenophaga sp. BPS33]QHE85983.1 NAD(P)H-dependent oxidoreductase [Hydrogenophaga sp. BPS33]
MTTTPTPRRPLVVLAHPNLGCSRLNAAMLAPLRARGSADVLDLVAESPNGDWDIAQHQQRLVAADRIVLQFPLTWYSAPPVLSTWLVRICQRGWAYGPGGRALNFKTFGVAVTTGSHGRDYTHEGRYRHSLAEVLTPYELLARHTGMHYLAPFAITAAREIDDGALAVQALAYEQHVLHATPKVQFAGRDDDRAKTVYTRPVTT